jgi:hypothetical protein
MESSKKEGRVSRAAVHVRTQELAVLAGRVPPQVLQADYEQAKREITGETQIDRQNAALDAHRGPTSKANEGTTPNQSEDELHPADSASPPFAS